MAAGAHVPATWSAAVLEIRREEQEASRRRVLPCPDQASNSHGAHERADASAVLAAARLTCEPLAAELFTITSSLLPGLHKGRAFPLLPLHPDTAGLWTGLAGKQC